MTVDRSRLGLPGQGNAEIIDMKADPDTVEELLKRKDYYPAYHMDEIGGFLGWVTVVCYLVSICTFIVKRINQFLISGLPRESKVRQYFSIFMKYIIKYHMYFGVGAGAFAVIHYFVQTSSGHESNRSDTYYKGRYAGISGHGAAEAGSGEYL